MTPWRTALVGIGAFWLATVAPLWYAAHEIREDWVWAMVAIGTVGQTGVAVLLVLAAWFVLPEEGRHEDIDDVG